MLRLELDAEHGTIHIPSSYLDLRENAAGIEQIEPARQHRPLRGLLAALNSGESLFSSVACVTWTKEVPQAAQTVEFGSRVDVIFTKQRHNFERDTYESLGSQLRVLLDMEAGGDTLAAEICVLRCAFDKAARPGYALRLILTGHGSTPQQAELRWSLGVAHLQQALLFLSRTVRQQQALSN
ncbi:MAG TPA: hypothetical protein VGQ11_11780 [Candidatus Acidoferrales bacterium]|nr:hypothetical protein [Candidatus Acidoferrales bacterium]